MISIRFRRSGPTRSTPPLLVALAVATLPGCEAEALELVHEIQAARGDCTPERLRAADEECVQMMEQLAGIGTEAVDTYLGGLRTLDRALERMPAPDFQTDGLGRAISPSVREALQASEAPLSAQTWRLGDSRPAAAASPYRATTRAQTLRPDRARHPTFDASSWLRYRSRFEPFGFHSGRWTGYAPGRFGDRAPAYGRSRVEYRLPGYAAPRYGRGYTLPGDGYPGYGPGYARPYDYRYDGGYDGLYGGGGWYDPRYSSDGYYDPGSVLPFRYLPERYTTPHGYGGYAGVTEPAYGDGSWHAPDLESDYHDGWYADAARSPAEDWGYLPPGAAYDDQADPQRSDPGVDRAVESRALEPPRHAPGLLLPPEQRLRRPWIQD